MEDNNKKNKKIIILVGVIISIIGICIAIPNYMKYIKTQKEISDANILRNIRIQDFMKL